MNPGKRLRYVRAGTSLLDGSDAVGYAMRRSKFESTDQFMARGNQVLRAVFENLQGDQERVDEIFSSLGSIARSNVPTSSIAKLIIELRVSNLWPSADISRLPVN